MLASSLLPFSLLRAPTLTLNIALIGATKHKSHSRSLSLVLNVQLRQIVVSSLLLVLFYVYTDSTE